MRVIPSRYTLPTATAIKKQPSDMKHVSAPIKGLSVASKQSEGDPLTATVLVNFVLEDDRIVSRAGYRKVATMADLKAIWHLIPFYSGAGKLLAAANNKLFDAMTGTAVKTGFASNDWHWTAFSNLSSTDYTVMVNGIDGVWSWDGALTSTDPAPVAVTNLSKANPAVCTVAPADISKFSNGMVVTIAGAVGTGLTNANGQRVITNVGVPANTFTLGGVDTSSATGPQTSGVTADPPSTGIVKEVVTASSSASWIIPDQFQIVLSHMNRLWFADSSNLAVYYLPIQQKSGEVKVLPLNAIFKKGGHIRAMATWTIDGGNGLDDQLVVFTSNGEAAIYSGTDPDTEGAWGLVGVFHFDAPMSKHSVINYGGDLYVLISTGVVPMTTVIRAETEHLGKYDKAVVSIFREEAIKFRANHGWHLMLNPSSGRLFANIPQGAPNRYDQMVRHMPTGFWTSYEDIPAHCWGWLDPLVYFGDDVGNVYEMHPVHLSDAGQPIRLDVQVAWNGFKTPATKQFKMLKVYMITDGDPKPLVDVKIDYDYAPISNQPDVSFATLEGAEWDTADWDTTDWAPGERALSFWNGVAAKGRVAAPRVTARVSNCKLAITGFDVLFEPGSAMG